jgi:flap endonuclease-1
MGIKMLNHFIKTNCSEKAIRSVHLSQLSGKTIAIDISIYMYKFLAEDALIENMYLMLATFRYYNIVPVFIFDGKPPMEKNDTLKKRKEEKKNAKREYKILSERIQNNLDMFESDKNDIMTSMSLLKKQFVYITSQDIETVKQMICAYGTTYYDAIGEADELCAMLVLKKKVWACLSEDMDLFVYGCPRVLRYMSLMNHSVVLYSTKHILNDLDLGLKDFREICVISGTDYNTNSEVDKEGESELYKTIKMYKKYKKSKEEIGFYSWLNKETKYIDDFDLLRKIYDMFDLTSRPNYIKVIEKMKIQNGMISKNNIRHILEKDGFIFSQ